MIRFSLNKFRQEKNLDNSNSDNLKCTLILIKIIVYVCDFLHFT